MRSGRRMPFGFTSFSLKPGEEMLESFVQKDGRLTKFLFNSLRNCAHEGCSPAKENATWNFLAWRQMCDCSQNRKNPGDNAPIGCRLPNQPRSWQILA